jgi:hypothetical protein
MSLSPYSSTSTIVVLTWPFPDRGTARVFSQTTHFTRLAGDPKITCSFPQEEHLTLRKRDLGMGMCFFMFFSNQSSPSL